MSHRFRHFSAEIKLLLFPPQPLQVNLNIQDTKVVFHLRGIVYKIQRSSFIYTALLKQDTAVIFHIHGNIFKIQRSSFIYTALFTRHRRRLSYTWHYLQDTEVVFHLHHIVGRLSYTRQYF